MYCGIYSVAMKINFTASNLCNYLMVTFITGEEAIPNS